MTRIEDLLREALAATPTPPATTDPLGDLGRRVRRARRRLAAGTGAVAAVIAAAIVVPLTVGGGGQPNSVGVIAPPTESPSPLPAGATALWTGNAIWASTSPSGERWLLYGDIGQSYVTRVSGKREGPFQVPTPADYIVAGDHVVWVIGGGDGRTQSVLTAIDPQKRQVATQDMPTSRLSFGAVIGDSLYVDESFSTGSGVTQFNMVNGDIQTGVSSPSVPAPGEIVATRQDNLWVHSGTRLVELRQSPGRLDVGARVPWGTGAMFNAALPRSAPDGVWAYDGDRLIALIPVALAECVSCAEGDRVTVPGRPNAVVETHDGLYVSVPGSGLYYYSPDALGSGETPVTASIKGVQVITMAADPTGGVDYVDDQGSLIHWQPVAG